MYICLEKKGCNRREFLNRTHWMVPFFSVFFLVVFDIYNVNLIILGVQFSGLNHFHIVVKLSPFIHSSGNTNSFLIKQ